MCTTVYISVPENSNKYCLWPFPKRYIFSLRCMEYKETLNWANIYVSNGPTSSTISSTFWRWCYCWIDRIIAHTTYSINLHTCDQLSNLWWNWRMWGPSPRQRLADIQSMFVCIDSGMFKSMPTDKRIIPIHCIIKQSSAGMRQPGNIAFVCIWYTDSGSIVRHKSLFSRAVWIQS